MSFLEIVVTIGGNTNLTLSPLLIQERKFLRTFYSNCGLCVVTLTSPGSRKQAGGSDGGMFSHRVGKKILAGHLGLDPMERNPPCKDLVEGEADRGQNVQRPKSGIPVACVQGTEKDGAWIHRE